MCLYYSCYHLPRRMGLFWSGALSEDSKLMHRMLLVYQSSYRHLNQYVEPLSPLSRFATNIFMDTTQILSLTVSFERTQTKTNNCTTIYLPTLAIHFVCQDFPIYFLPSIILQYILFRTTIVDRSNYQSDQTEQQDTLHCLLISNKRISTILPVLALALVASA